MDELSTTSTATHSLQSSTNRRRGTSPALLYLVQACLQRARAATSSGVKAWNSSPRSILSFSVESDIFLDIYLAGEGNSTGPAVSNNEYVS